MQCDAMHSGKDIHNKGGDNLRLEWLYKKNVSIIGRIETCLSGEKEEEEGPFFGLIFNFPLGGEIRR